MRTSKPVSTISYNSKEFLTGKLEELIRNHKISDYMAIFHYAEKDETKDHWHLLIKPNTLIDTMDIQDFFKEFDPEYPTKPKKCIDFRITHDIDDWILYSQHYAPYLASKAESREFHYAKSDFIYHDEDNFNDLYLHAFKGSAWAKQYQILEQLNSKQLSPIDLIKNGTVPLNMASQLNAYKYMEKHYSTLDRGSHTGHDPIESISLTDPKAAEAMFRYTSDHDNFMAFEAERIPHDLSMAEWIYNYRLESFNEFCISEYGFQILETEESGDGAQTTAEHSG